MHKGPFNITYQNEILKVEENKDVNEQFFYSVTFPDREKIDIYVTPSGDGLAF